MLIKDNAEKRSFERVRLLRGTAVQDIIAIDWRIKVVDAGFEDQVGADFAAEVIVWVGNAVDSHTKLIPNSYSNTVDLVRSAAGSDNGSCSCNWGRKPGQENCDASFVHIEGRLLRAG